MRRLDVEFVPSRPNWALLAMWTLCCLAVAGFLGYRSWQVQLQVQLLDHQSLQIAMKINELEEARSSSAHPVVEAVLPPYYQDASILVKTAAFPTQQVLRALEQTHVQGVRIASTDINPERGSVDLAVEFTDLKALLSYVEMLNEGEPESRWRLSHAESGSVGDKKQAQITASW